MAGYRKKIWWQGVFGYVVVLEMSILKAFESAANLRHCNVSAFLNILQNSWQHRTQDAVSSSYEAREPQWVPGSSQEQHNFSFGFWQSNDSVTLPKQRWQICRVCRKKAHTEISKNFLACHSSLSCAEAAHAWRNQPHGLCTNVRSGSFELLLVGDPVVTDGIFLPSHFAQLRHKNCFRILPNFVTRTLSNRQREKIRSPNSPPFLL